MSSAVRQSPRLCPGLAASCQVLVRRLQVAGGLFALVTGVALAQGYDRRLEYQQRGDRFEGLRARPVGGGAQLLSARVVETLPPGRSSSATWGSRATLRFYLPSQGDVALTVRPSRAGSLYYVLDRVAATWRVGEVNPYSWETAPVLQRLSSIRPADLGAVVNLGPGKDTNREKVLPVVLFDDVVGNGPKTYRLTFKTDARVKVDAKIYKENEPKPVFQRPTNTEEPGSPFTIVWQADPSTTREDGWYRLVLQGPFEDGKSKLDKEVTFYHRPMLGSPKTQR